MGDTYIDYADYLQKQINALVSGQFKVYAERNLDSMIDGDVVVSAKSGKYYRSSAEIPYEINIMTSKPKETLDFFTNFFKKLNNTSFVSIVGEEDEKEIYNITQFYQTPSIIDKDIDIGSEHYARIITFGSLYITYNVSNIEELKIDNELIEFETATLAYVVDPHANKRSGNITVKSRVRTNTTSVAFSTVNKNSVFCNKLFKIMLHQLDANTTFTVDVKMSNGLTGQLTMIISQSNVNAAKAALTGDNITLIEYDTGEQNASN